MKPPASIHGPHGGEQARGRVVQFRAGEDAAAALAAHNEDLAIRKQRRCMELPLGGHGSGEREGLLDRVVQFRGGEGFASVVGASRDEHLAVGKQGRGGAVADGVHVPQAGEAVRYRIVKFRAGQEVAGGAAAECEEIGSPGDEDLAVGQQRRGMVGPGRDHVIGGGPVAVGRVVELRLQVCGSVLPARQQDQSVGERSRRLVASPIAVLNGGRELARGRGV